jgi:hypothetical protein
MGSFSFWQKWLLVVSILIAGLGVFIIIGSFLGGDNSQIDPEFLQRYHVITFEAFRLWIFAVLGATLAGWGVCLIFIAHYPFKRKELWAWNCLVAGILVWYVLDTFASLYFKVYFNAIFNTILLGLSILPLIFTRKHFIS